MQWSLVLDGRVDLLSLKYFIIIFVTWCFGGGFFFIVFLFILLSVYADSYRYRTSITSSHCILVVTRALSLYRQGTHTNTHTEEW